MLQWNASPYAPPVAAAGEPRGLQAAVARAEQRLAQERASEMARIMEQSMAAAVEGRDLLAEMRAAASRSSPAAARGGRSWPARLRPA